MRTGWEKITQLLLSDSRRPTFRQRPVVVRGLAMFPLYAYAVRRMNDSPPRPIESCGAERRGLIASATEGSLARSAKARRAPDHATRGRRRSRARASLGA